MSSQKTYTIHVSTISRRCRSTDLRGLFGEYGGIRRINIKSDKSALVEFNRSHSVNEAMNGTQGRFFMGHRLRTKLYYKSDHVANDKYCRHSRSIHDYRLYVSGLSRSTTNQDLQHFAATAGRSVTFADIRRTKPNGSQIELEGIIEYSDKRDFQRALHKLYGCRLCGARVKIYCDDQYSQQRYGNRYSNSNSFKSQRNYHSRDRSKSPHQAFRKRSKSPHQTSRKRSKSRDRTSTRNDTHSPQSQIINNYQDCSVVNGDFNKIINKTKKVYYADKAKELGQQCVASEIVDLFSDRTLFFNFQKFRVAMCLIGHVYETSEKTSLIKAMQGGRNGFAKYIRTAKQKRTYKLRTLYDIKNELTELTFDDLKGAALLFDTYCRNNGSSENVMTLGFLHKANLSGTTNIETIEAACTYGCDIPGIRVIDHLNLGGQNVTSIDFADFCADYVCTDQDCVCEQNVPVSWTFVQKMGKLLS